MSSSRRPCSPSPSSSSPTTSPSTAAPTWTSRATWPRASPSSDGGAPGRPPGRRSRPPLVARRHRHQGDRGAAPQDRRLPLRVRRRRPLPALSAEARRARAFFAATACCAACLTTFVVATKWTTAANAVFLQYSGVVWVFLLAPLVVGEPRHARDALAIAVALGGMALFFGGPLEARAHA